MRPRRRRRRIARRRIGSRGAPLPSAHRRVVAAHVVLGPDPRRRDRRGVQRAGGHRARRRGRRGPACSEPADVGADVPSPMADLPMGAKFGTLVHAVLETADPFAADLAAELETQIREHSVWWPVDVPRRGSGRGAGAAARHPAGPAGTGVTLRQIGLRDRLREMDFEFPLAGGDLRGERAGDLTWPTSGGCWPSICPPMTRWPPTPSGCRAARWARSRCGAT